MRPVVLALRRWRRPRRPGGVLVAGSGDAVPAPAGARVNAVAPPPDERWQYQLESANRDLASTGGIDVDICSRLTPAAPACVPTSSTSTSTSTGGSSGNNHTINTAAVEAIHDRGAHAVCYVSAGDRRALSPRLPQVRQVRPAPSPQPDRQAVQQPVPERVLAQPQERSRPARLHPAASRGADREVRPGRLRRGRVRRRRRLRPGAQGHRLADHGRTSARLQPRAGTDRAPQRPLGGAQERPRAAPNARAPLRLRDQRAVLPVPRVHEQPPSRVPGLHPRRQGGVPGRVPDPPQPLLRQGRRLGLSRDQEGGRLLAATPGPGSPAARPFRPRRWDLPRRNQLAGVHDPRRVEALLDRSKDLDPQLADLGRACRERGRGPRRGGG